jgi:hypothetical protein
MGLREMLMIDAIDTLLQRAPDYSGASKELCAAFYDGLRQATDLVGTSRDAIARSKDRMARLAIWNQGVSNRKFRRVG